MKVLVVGGGIIGLTLAWRLSQSGFSVQVFDDERPGAATGCAAGLLIPAGGRMAWSHLALRQASAQMYPQFVAELETITGLSCRYRSFGTLTLAYGPRAETTLAGLANCLKGYGISAKLLHGDQCRLFEPELSSEVGGGFHLADAQVDPFALNQALDKACRLAGVKRQKSEVVEVSSRAIVLKGGEKIAADKVVVANGAWLGQLLGLAVFPVRGQVLHLRLPELELTHNVNVQGQELYLAPRGQGLVVVGATEEEVGFVLDDSEGWALKAKAERLLPCLSRASVVEVRTGFRPKVGDGLPLLGEFEGMLVAGAHYRNGILLAPITAHLLTAYLTRDEEPSLMQAFSPRRDTRSRRPADL